MAVCSQEDPPLVELSPGPLGGVPPAPRGDIPDSTRSAIAGMTERFDDKREAILDGAARLFNQHGIKGGLLSDLARRVGLATNSLTYYYRKKEDLATAPACSAPSTR